MAKQIRILAIIPSYNEEKSIAHVIGAIKDSDPSIDILVVNDGSSDNTGSVAKSTGMALHFESALQSRHWRSGAGRVQICQQKRL